MLKKFHHYHMVEKSPWPVLASNNALFLVTSILLWINTDHIIPIQLALLTMLIISAMWWTNVSSETAAQGNHLPMVTKGLQIGMILFITSEVLFFFSFFWAFFHSSISPNVEMGQTWPPAAILPFNPMNIPLLNTIILLSSGVSVTWCHHSILKSEMSSSKTSLEITVILGILFTVLQAFEYKEAPFTISDSAYGTTFFMATGFHGLHVLIGSTFLTVSAMRMMKMLNSSDHLTGFECAAWYWHFVDVVWLFLYSSMYWWGS